MNFKHLHEHEWLFLPFINKLQTFKTLYVIFLTLYGWFISIYNNILDSLLTFSNNKLSWLLFFINYFINDLTTTQIFLTIW